MKNKWSMHLGLSLLVILLLTACGGGGGSARIEDSLSTTEPVVGSQPISGEGSEGHLSVDRNYLRIHKSALEKDFLLQSSFSVQVEIPLPNGGKSRVVTFKERGDNVVMLESTRGQRISADLPQDFLISTFPIKARKGDWISFDFAEGMSKAFIGFDWYASDSEGAQYQPNFSALSVADSYLDYARVSANNTLTVRQVVQVNDADRQPLEVKYYFSRYTPASDFEAFVNEVKNFDWFGFFEVRPTLEIGGESLVHASKWNAKSIVYAISANTPAEWRPAIRDGVLYWNKVFGRNVVKVIDAPEGVVAPDADYNVIQWVNWDDAGFAYADAQMDPLTGEIMHAQIFLTSAFANDGALEAKDLMGWSLGFLRKKIAALRKSGPQDFRRVQPVAKAFAIRGMEKGPLCFEDHSEALSSSLRELKLQGVSDMIIDTMTGDYLREVVAHEVGHTLGLRHNFAGSLDAFGSMADVERAFKSYRETGEADVSAVVTSSVMDYQRFQEATLTGSLIRNVKAEAFRYDQKALDILYAGKNPRSLEAPLYCSDSHVGQYVDCNRFDASTSVLDSTTSMAAAMRKNLARDVAAAIAEWRIQNPDEEWAKMPFEPMEFVEWVLNQTFDIYYAFMPELLPYLSIVRTSSADENILGKSVAMVEKEVKRLGGYEAILPLFPASFGRLIRDQVKDWVADPEFMTRANSKNQTLALSPGDLEALSTLIDGWFGERFRVNLVGLDLVILDAMRAYSSVDSFNAYGPEKASLYFTSRLSSSMLRSTLRIRTKTKRWKTINVDIPLYENKSSFQMLLAQILASETTLGVEVASYIMDDISRSLGGQIYTDIDMDSLPPVVADWLYERQALVETLTQHK